MRTHMVHATHGLVDSPPWHDGLSSLHDSRTCHALACTVTYNAKLATACIVHDHHVLISLSCAQACCYWSAACKCSARVRHAMLTRCHRSEPLCDAACTTCTEQWQGNSCLLYRTEPWHGLCTRSLKVVVMHQESAAPCHDGQATVAKHM